MQVIKKIPIFFLAMMLCIGMIALPAFAASSTQDGLEVTLTTDKEAYSQNEQIVTIVTVTNTNEVAVSNVSLENVIPEGYKLADDSEATKQVESLGSGETVTLTVTYIADAISSEETDSVSGDNSESGDNSGAETGNQSGIDGNGDSSGTDNSSSNSGNAGSDSNSGNIANTGTGNNSSSDQNSNEKTDSVPETDDNANIVIWVVLLVVAGAGIVTLLFLKKKNGKKLLSLILGIAIVGSSVLAVFEKAYAAEIQNNQISIEKTVTVDDMSLTLACIISYDLSVASDDDYTTFSVAFDLRFEEIVKDTTPFEVQTVVEGDKVSRPTDPEPVVGEFAGWYTSLEYDEEFDFDQSIVGDTVIYAKWEIDTTDTDGDGLYDSIEEYLGLDSDNVDTDGDGINDYDELIIGTDPLLIDSDGNGISDYDEDADEDGLSNGTEISIGASPIRADSDYDGLDDAEEVNLYGTDPTLADTDGDGAKDGWEVLNGYDPLVYNSTFIVTAESEGVTDANPVSASVEIQLEGTQIESLEVKHTGASDNPLLSASVAGYLGSAYEFSVDGSFTSATLTFEYDTQLGEIGDDFQPRIYYFDEENGTFEELDNQTVENGRVSANTTHFSTYILLNKVKVDEVWATEIKTPDEFDEQITGIDIVFIIDSSGSMKTNDSSDIRKSAAKEFVDKLGENDRAAVIDFDSSATLYQEFTSDHDLLYDAIDRIDSSGGTNLSKGMELAISQFTSDEYTRTDAYTCIIFLTDGDGTYSTSYTTEAADNGIVVYTVGLGSGVQESVLTSIAEGTGGKYYFASVAEELPDIFSEVSFETVDYTTDTNNDGISDYYTQLIYEGKLLLSNGSDEFVGIDFNYDVNGDLSDDFDGDGLKNGEELQVVKNGNKVYLKMTSDPMMLHSDDDGIDDYQEVQKGTNPLKAEYDKGSIDWLSTDSNYYYEYFVSTYDDSNSYQLASGILAAIYGVWNIEELGRDIMADYFSTYVESFDNVIEKNERAILVENADNLLSVISKIKKARDDLSSIISWKAGVKNLISVANGYVTNIEEIAVEYTSYVEQIAVYDESAGLFKVTTYSMSNTSVSVLTSQSPLETSSINGVSIALNVWSGAIDIADTLATFAEVNANAQIFDENMDILLELRDNGKRVYNQNAAADIVNELAEGYGSALAEAIGDDVAEMTLNIIITIASSNPYIKAVKFVRDTVGMITGVKDTLKYEYQMLTYSDMAYCINNLISNSIYSSGSYYYENTTNVPRYLTNLAQIRILGEKKYEENYTNGVNSWIIDEDTIKSNISTSISLVQNCASKLGLELADELM